MAALNCLVVTPEATAVEATADFIAVPLYDGELGIAPQHSPMIGRLGYGELRLKTGGQEQRYYIDGGFVQVVDDVVSVLTNRAVAASAIDADAARAQLAEAQQRPAHSPELIEIRDRLIRQARAQIRVAERS